MQVAGYFAPVRFVFKNRIHSGSAGCQCLFVPFISFHGFDLSYLYPPSDLESDPGLPFLCPPLKKNTFIFL